MSKKTQSFLAIAACVFFTAILYWPTLKAPFIFDDYIFIVDNPNIKGFKSILSKLEPGSRNLNRDSVQKSRPLTFFTFALNRYWDPEGTLGYHSVNLLIHIFNTILIYFLTRKIFSALNEPLPLFPLLGATLLFSLHPLQTEAVSNISRRPDSLATLFYLLSLWFFIKTFERSKKYFFLSLSCFVLSFLSKEIAATLPLTLLMADYIFLSDFKIAEIKRKKIYHLLFWSLLLILLGWRSYILGEYAGPGEEAYKKWTSSSYLLTQFWVLVQYWKLLLVPIGQCLDHDISPIKTLLDLRVLSGMSLMCFFFLPLYFVLKRNPRLFKIALFAVAWFFITLSPTSSVIPLPDAMVERRLYLPAWGFVLLILSFYLYFTQPQRTLSIFLAGYLLFLSAAAWKRNSLYLNPVLLWQEAVSKYPNNARAYNNLGVEYFYQGKVPEAMKAYRRSVELNPEQYDSYFNLGAIEKNQPAALAAYLNAIRSNPKLAEAHNNIGKIFFDLKEYEQAFKYFKEAVKIDPNLAISHYNLANLYRLTKDYGNALRHYQKTTESDPAHADAYNNQGVLYLERKEYGRALEAFEKAVQLSSNAVEIQMNLGNAYSQTKKYEKALAHYQKAIEIDPDSVDAHYNLGGSYYEQKKYGQALKEFLAAERLAPDDQEIKDRIRELRGQK